MTTVIERRSAAAKKAYARRPKRAAKLTLQDIGGPEAPHRGTARGDYTVRELLDRMRSREAAE